MRLQHPHGSERRASRPRLIPALADLRRAVRVNLGDLGVYRPATEGTGAGAVLGVGVQVGRDASRTVGADSGIDSGVGVGVGTADLEADLDTVAPQPHDAAFAVQQDAQSATSQVASSSDRPLVLVAMSGGPDSVALAAGAAFVAPRMGLRVGAAIIDHGLQEASALVATKAAEVALGLGLHPVVVRRVAIASEGGPEAAAREARFAALRDIAEETGAVAVLLGHTLDDQAETVLLGLARGSGTRSLQAMAPVNGLWRRPLLGIRRASTVAICEHLGLTVWLDPHNEDHRFARVRVRRSVLPVMESELGPGIAEALARTAELLQSDNEVLESLAEKLADSLTGNALPGDAENEISLPVSSTLGQPPALLHRALRLIAERHLGEALSFAQTVAVVQLCTDWHGQGPVSLPGGEAHRRHDRIVFTTHVDKRTHRRREP